MRSSWASAVGAIAALILSSCTEPPDPGVHLSTFQTSQKLFLTKRYAGAAAGFKSFLEAAPSSPHAPGAAYWAALCDLRLGDLEGAARGFEQSLKLLKRNPAAHAREFLSASAPLGLADCAFRANDFGEAAERYREALDQSSSHIDEPRALYQLGLCYARESRWLESRSTFQQVLARFPKSEEAAQARQKLGAKDAFAVQVGCFSTQRAAMSLREALASRGFDSQIVPRSKGDTVLHSVRVGPFAKWAEAKAAADKLKLLGYGEALIVP